MFPNFSAPGGNSYSRLFLAGILILYLFNGAGYIHAQSLTSDEGSFYDYATRYAKGNPQRIDPELDNSKMPVSVLNIIPRAVTQVFKPALKKTDGGMSDILGGRYVTLFLSLFTILLVYRWATELYGIKAGLFAAFLTAACPNLIASAGLVTTDSYSALALTACMYLAWKYCSTGRIRHFVWMSLAIALSQLVKQSLFHLYILIPALFSLYYFVNKPRVKGVTAFKLAGIFILINWFVLNTGYYFYQTNAALNSYAFMSNLFKSIADVLPGGLPVPLPRPFVEGLDQAKFYDQAGGGIEGLSSFANVTILGRSATGHGFWYYYFVSIFFKTPITYLVFFISAAVLMIKRISVKHFSKEGLFLLLPVFYFIFIFSFLYKTQCGLRHLVFIFPLLFVFSSFLIGLAKSLGARALIAALCIFLITSISRYRDNYYAYTNEFIFNKTNAYNYVGANNLDFRGGRKFFQEYLRSHPAVTLPPAGPRAGTYLISVTDYLDVWNTHKFDWISAVKPMGHVAYNGLLVRVTEGDLAR